MPGTLILNAEGTESLRRARTDILGKEGFAIVEAAGARKALEIAAAQRPALVLLGETLADGSGLDVCRDIKAGRETAAIPVLQISSADHGPADIYLADPVDPAVLIATVRILLRIHSANRRLQLLAEVTADLLSQDAAPEAFIRDLYTKFSSELGLEIYFHYQVAEDRTGLNLCAWGGVPPDVAQKIEHLEYGQAVCGTVASTRQRVVAEDVQNSTDRMTEVVRSLGITAYVCHPLMVHDRFLGTLSFGTRTRTRFHPDEVNLLQTLCHQVAIALERSRLRRDLLVQTTLLDHVRNAVIATDGQGAIVQWNKAAESMYLWKAEEVLGKNIMDVTVPPSGREQGGTIVASMANNGYWEGEFRVQRKDGTTFPALVSDSAIRSREGEVIGFVGVSTDLSQQKRAEEVLRASEERYRRIVETAAEGVWILDASGHTTFVNRRMANLLGYDCAEMQGRSISEIDFDGEPTAIPMEHRRSGESEEFELRLRRKDGSAMWARIAASPLQDEHGNFLGALRMVTDISERKRAEQALVKNEQKFRRLVEANIIGVITADLERVIDANEVFLEMTGYTRQELDSGNIRWPQMTPPEYDRLDRRAVGEMLQDGACRPFEKELYRKDGTRVPILIGAALLTRKPEWLCFVLDLTERKKAEAALREVQKFESLGFLAGGVAHNLNNLLVGVLGNVSLVAETANLPPEDHELLQDALKSAESAANLTTKLLAYAGKGRFIQRTIELSGFIGNLEGLFRGSISKKIDLHYDLTPDLPPIDADEDQIRQIVSNLVINAAEAIGGDPGRIDIATRLDSFEEFPPSNSYTVGQTGPGAHVVLTVTDTGSGIDRETVPKIFDPFFTTKFTGRGLGLAAVAGIVRSHGGAIALSTAPGTGARFDVWLPVTESQPRPDR